MSASDAICVGDLEVRPHEHVILVGGREVPLSLREFEIAFALAEHPGWVFSAEQLCAEPDESAYSPESVSVLVSRLRHKLAEAGAPDLIETVRGAGYRLHARKGQSEEATAADAAGSCLRDAAWQLQEAVFEVEHSGTAEQKREATDVLEYARRELYARLAE